MIKTFLHFLLLSSFFKSQHALEKTIRKKAFDSGGCETAYTLWLPLAENGDAEAQNYLGLFIIQVWVHRKTNIRKRLYSMNVLPKQGMLMLKEILLIWFILCGRGTEKDIQQACKWYFTAFQQENEKAKRQIAAIAASGNLSPNQQMYAKIDANEFILDETKHFMSHDT